MLRTVLSTLHLILTTSLYKVGDVIIPARSDEAGICPEISLEPSVICLIVTSLLVVHPWECCWGLCLGLSVEPVISRRPLQRLWVQRTLKGF